MTIICIHFLLTWHCSTSAQESPSTPSVLQTPNAKISNLSSKTSGPLGRLLRGNAFWSVAAWSSSKVPKIYHKSVWISLPLHVIYIIYYALSPLFYQFFLIVPIKTYLIQCLIWFSGTPTEGQFGKVVSFWKKLLRSIYYEIVLKKPSAWYELKILGILITMKLEKVFHFKNALFVNGYLNNSVSEL